MFGGSPGHRHIPGLGTSRQPEIYMDDGSFDKILVPESETIRMCRQVARSYGLLLGGSSGTALAAIAASLDGIPAGSTVLALSPDMGHAYLDTVYDDVWVLEHFGPGPLNHAAESACGESALTRRTDNDISSARRRKDRQFGKLLSAVPAQA
jgi:cysteine synthase A